MRVLGLDPAASSGWCVIEDGAYFDGGTEEFTNPTQRQLKKGVHRGSKWLGACEWYFDIIAEYKPNYIFIEDVKGHTGTLAAQQYGFYRYTAEAAAAGHLCPFVPIGVGVWKKELGVGGGAAKEMVMSEMQRRFTGVNFVTHDHSDAAGIAFVGYKLVIEDRLAELEPKRKPRKAH